MTNHFSISNKKENQTLKALNFTQTKNYPKYQRIPKEPKLFLKSIFLRLYLKKIRFAKKVIRLLKSTLK